MIDRGEVDRILNSIKGNKPTARASITSERLAALCRRWLAVEDAPCAVAGQSPGRFYYVGGSAPVEHGQRVRLVPEQGEGESRD